MGLGVNANKKQPASQPVPIQKPEAKPEELTQERTFENLEGGMVPEVPEETKGYESEPNVMSKSKQEV